MLNTTFKIDCFALSDRGRVRKNNEDRWNMQSEKGLFLLADGMGGHRSGEIAAESSIEKFLRFMEELPEDSLDQEQVQRFFRHCFLEVNKEIFLKSKTKEELQGMGTTLSCLFFYQDLAWIGHVGDSRIYCMRHNKLEQLTRDHSLMEEWEKENHFFLTPQSSYKHILTRAIGTQGHVEPDIRSFNLQEEDLFLLCSDGLTNYVINSKIEALLQEKVSLKEKALALLEEANAQGGGDNITVILVNLKK